MFCTVINHMNLIASVGDSSAVVLNCLTVELTEFGNMDKLKEWVQDGSIQTSSAMYRVLALYFSNSVVR